MADKKDKGPTLPKYHDTGFDELFEKFKGYVHPSKQREMRRKTRVHTKNLETELDEFMGGKDYTEEPVEERKKGAAKLVEKLAQDWYKSHLGIEVEEMTEDHIQAYLNESGALREFGSYKKLLEYLIDNEASLDVTDEQNRYLQQLVQHNAQARDSEGKDLQQVQRTLVDDHYFNLKPGIEKEVGKEFKANASAVDLLREYQMHVNKSYDKPKKTYEYDYGKAA